MMAQPEIRVHRIDTGRITLNVREIGVGTPAVFLHGITSNSAVFDPLLFGLKERFRCISVDQRGHGLSDKPDSGYGAKDYAEDLVALIRTLNAGPAVVIGNSLGARNGIEVAAMAPDLIKCVVAIDFTPYIEKEVFDALEARVKAGDRIFRSRKEIEVYLRDRYPLMPPDAVRRRAMSAYREVEGGFKPLASPKAMALTAAGLRDDLRPAFTKVTRPVLVVRGALSKFVSAAALEKSRQLRPDFPVLVVDNVDHYVNEEAPDVIIEAILDFTARI
ncbi:MAG: alpha/beta hydrolase [Pseudolabrys sp.]|nr:alpha/beta hydrolase [Pseudolabrys sp.]